MQPKELETLRRSSLFMGLNDDEFDMVVHCLQPFTMSFKRGQSIYPLNGGYERIGILLSGKSSGYYESTTGDTMLLFTAEPGELLGGPDLCSNKIQIFNQTITADSACVFAFMRNSPFSDYCNSEWSGIVRQKVSMNLIYILSNKCNYFYQRVLFISMKSIRKKICSYLLTQYALQRNPSVILPMNRKELAKYLNIIRPSLSRELSFLQRNHIILFSKNAFQILDIHQLEQYAEGSLL